MDGANPSFIGVLKDRVDEDGHVSDDVIGTWYFCLQ